MTERNDTDHDDLETVIETLREHHNAEMVIENNDKVNPRDEQIRYYDTHETMVTAGALRYLQKQGFGIEMAGAHYLGAASGQRGWVDASR